MPAKFSVPQQVSNIIARTIPKKGSFELEGSTAEAVLKGFARLDAAARENAALVFSVNVENIDVAYDGTHFLSVHTAQKGVTVWCTSENKATRLFRRLSERGDAEEAWGDDDLAWRLRPNQIEQVWKLIEGLPVHDPPTMDTADTSRRFSAADRNMAYQSFESSGRMCPGVRGAGISAHKVKPTERIEFDHILPHAKGGSNSVRNVQVMCERCNRVKSDRID